jgi:hypothetical protein
VHHIDPFSNKNPSRRSFNGTFTLNGDLPVGSRPDDFRRAVFFRIKPGHTLRRAGARSSVDLTMYELADPTAEADLAARPVCTSGCTGTAAGPCTSTPRPSPPRLPATTREPHPTPGPAPQPPAESGFWCTANAADYNASYHENNVYVNSDLRYQEVTASTDAYSSTILTNGFGYAVIFLNGPSPGVTITVKVGSATRSARD